MHSVELEKLENGLRQLYSTVPSYNITALHGDASSRRYMRVSITEPVPDHTPHSLMVMVLPEDAFKSDEGADDTDSTDSTDSKPPTQLPFLDVQALLQQQGVPVPAVYLEAVEDGLIFLEDLGDETFEARLHTQGQAAWPTLYGHAVDLVTEMHQRCEPSDANTTQQSIAYQRSFDQTLLRWECDHFREWGLEALFGDMSPHDRRRLDRIFDALVASILQSPQGFVHRDVQSRNLMWHQNRLVVIDFQDALLGPVAYDLVALLCDSYVDISGALQEEMLTRYAHKRGYHATQTQLFRAMFWQVAIQRKLKDAGRFVYIDRVRDNPDFLRWFPQSLRYVAHAIQQAQRCLQMSSSNTSALNTSAPMLSTDDLNDLQNLLQSAIPGYPNKVAVPL